MADFDPVWLGYAALLVLAGASLSAHLVTLRIGLALAAGLGLLAAILAGWGIVVPLLLAGVLIINLSHLASHALREARTGFTDEEQALREAHFGTMTARAARHLIDQGHWIKARRGEVLIRENQAAPSLFFLAEGGAVVRRSGEVVGTVHSGALIGEATALDGSDATGTVELNCDARLWFIPATVLRDYLAANPAIASSLHEGFARALRGKLASANTRLAGNEAL